MHVAPACRGSDHFGSYVHSLSLHFCKKLLPRLKLMTLMVTRQQLYHCVTAPLLINLTKATILFSYKWDRDLFNLKHLQEHQ
jgi:hypothetical protein